jgi:hypothetical protein
MRPNLSHPLGFVHKNAKKNNRVMKERDFFSSLLIEMLHGGEIFKNEG